MAATPRRSTTNPTKPRRTKKALPRSLSHTIRRHPLEGIGAHHKALLLFGAIIILTASASSITGATSIGIERVCTRVVEVDDSMCEGDRWSAWRTVDSWTADALGTRAVTQRRVLNGLRAERHIIQYVSRGQSCMHGFVAVQSGESAGQFGFMKEATNVARSEGVSCATEETRDVIGGVVGTTTRSELSDGTREVAVSTLSSLDDVVSFLSKVASVRVEAIPATTPEGNVVQIDWTSGEVASCSVTAPNGDAWTGTSGSERSLPIKEAITYTAECIVPNGIVVTDSFTVEVE